MHTFHEHIGGKQALFFVEIQQGCIVANAQNTARLLKLELRANVLDQTEFSQVTQGCQGSILTHIKWGFVFIKRAAKVGTIRGVIAQENKKNIGRLPCGTFVFRIIPNKPRTWCT
jgi:hypothetical protein